jgi:hypothetical protein
MADEAKPEAPKPMPEKNYFFDSLPPNCHVEERKTLKGSNSYYVAIIDGVEGVINMEGRFQHQQQAALDKMVVATKRRTGLLPPKHVNKRRRK